MKTSRVLSAALVATLAAGGFLFVSSAAFAETTIGDATFYDASDFGVESGGYPGGFDWFFGDVTGTEGAHAFTLNGLELNSGLTGDVQILNQNVVQPVDAVDFIDRVLSLYVEATGSFNLQIPLFANGGGADTEFTTLRPDFLGNHDGTAGEDWVTSGAFGTYSAGDVDTLANFATALYPGASTPELLGYGVFIEETATAAIEGIAWDGDIQLFIPIPTRTISHTTITVADATSTGFTLTGTNWRPNSGIYLDIDDPNGDDVVLPSLGTADALGNVSITVILPADSVPGVYEITFDDGAGEGDGFFFDLDVFVDEPFTTITLEAALAATGPDENTGVVAALAALFGLAGIGLVVASRRRTARYPG